MIRKVTYGDTEGVVEIIKDYLTSVKKITNEKEEEILHYILKMIGKENNLYVKVGDKGKVEGYINYHICDFPLVGGREIYISELFVSSSIRGKKVGSDLLEYVIEKAKLEGIKRILLNNSKNSESFARNFYSKHGFQAREFMTNFILEL